MASMNDVPTPYMTFIPQATPPAVPPSGQIRLYLLATDARLYTIDASGDIQQLSTEVWGPISNGNPAAPNITNARGAILLSRRA